VRSHGVGAAWLSISVMNVPRSQNLPGVDFRNPGDVLTALNRAFTMESQHNLYFTIWYGVANRCTGQLAFASGGHPPAILLTGPERAAIQVERLKTLGAPVGAFPETAYVTLNTRLQAFSRLFVFSDGAYEVVRRDGSLFTLEGFTQHLTERTRAGSDDLQVPLSFLETSRGSTTFEDDLAVVEIGFSGDPTPGW
jgi:phosphoserine phosphatase RsbU/P